MVSKHLKQQQKIQHNIYKHLKKKTIQTSTKVYEKKNGKKDNIVCKY